jgi:hypothetical protein
MSSPVSRRSRARSHRSVRLPVLVFISMLAAVSATGQTDFEFWPGARYEPSVPSIREVLGHGPGEKIFPHAELMSYMDALAKAEPDRVRVFEYARSWEGRKLVYAVIGSEENIGRLDEIKTAMQKLADPRTTTEADASRIIDSFPAVTWLAYGIHGNEISSPNAGLLTAYHLLAARGDDVVDSILADTLVIIDPTQNPDGRDRFVHNFEIARGPKPDAHPLAAEHNEPWPGGRTNHYYFDLNRDYVALTQVETRGRVKAFQEWYPQVFVDLHEMGSNSTYFFEPPPPPYNPHVTSTLRANAEVYAKNNARWFDRFGFPYFTREIFGGVYPGYASSWPLFNGSLGMTYEQASSRGLVMRRTDGTDLLFRDTVRHHFVASISSAETTARHRKKMLTDFYEYRRSAIEEGRTEGVRTYILPNGGDSSTVAKLAGILVEHGIDVRRAKTTFSGCGQDYPPGTYAVSLAQPTKRLIRTLLEPDVVVEEDFVKEQERRRRKRLGDQFYDVTAWSLPTLFGVESIACGEALSGDFEAVGSMRILPGAISGEKAGLAYLVPWGTAAAGRFLAAAIQEDLRILSSDKTFSVGGKKYPAGSLIIRVDQNPADLHRRIERLVTETGAHADATDTGWVEDGVSFGSPNVLHVRRPRVALAWDRPTWSTSAGSTRFVLERQFGYPVTPIRTSQLAGANISSFDVLILPAGRYDSYFGESDTERLRDWVRAGGTLIGLGGALEFLTSEKVGLLAVSREDKASASEAGKKDGEKPKADKAKSKIFATEADYLEAIKPETELPDSVPGVLVKARLDRDNWMSAGVEGTVSALLFGSNIYSPITLDQGVNAAVLLGPDELLAGGYLWEENRKQLAYKPLVIVQEHGRGLVVGFTADPNYRALTDGMNVLFLNAVFRGPARARPATAPDAAADVVFGP